MSLKLLSIDHVSVTDDFGEQLFSRVGLTLFSSSCLCVYGGGKFARTSLLRAISSVIIPESGNVTMYDLSLGSEVHCDDVFHLGYASILYNTLSVEDNLRLWAAIYRGEDRISAVVQLFELSEYLSVDVCRLPGNIRQRVRLSVLMISNASIWIIEEPFQSMDDFTVKRFLEIVQVRCSNNGIVVYSNPFKYVYSNKKYEESGGDGDDGVNMDFILHYMLEEGAAVI